MKAQMLDVLEDMNRSIPSLQLASPDILGWCHRMERQYGHATLCALAAAAIRANPSPSLQGEFSSWAAKQKATDVVPDMPFWVLKALTTYLIGG